MTSSSAVALDEVWKKKKKKKMMIMITTMTHVARRKRAVRIFPRGGVEIGGLENEGEEEEARALDTGLLNEEEKEKEKGIVFAATAAAAASPPPHRRGCILLQ